ncbi:hypothetical protein V498_06061 [Pseudogymnoascus sp. VKM F-4517 (FW-2822)]|nr:hypothetical protein V498_06061 [Pseudogymnoascus sp. VKM F-4517 (FW-2822)]
MIPRNAIIFICYAAALGAWASAAPSSPGPTTHATQSNEPSKLVTRSLLAVFEDKSQLDVITVLLLLGEATIWKAIWSRFRSTRSTWEQWIFSVSPGWTPLAASIFAAMNGSSGPPNLIFDRPPEGVSEDGLLLTNLNSGATHAASNVILQNIWQVWNRGPRQHHRLLGKDRGYNVTRDVGVVDVDISALKLQHSWAVWIQVSALLIQLVVSFSLAFFGWSFEVFTTFCIALSGQMLLILAITPRQEAWNHRLYKVHRPCQVMLHRGLDSMEVLFVRKAVLNGTAISLEEFTWSSQALRNKVDLFKTFCAGISFLILAFQIICVSWMNSESRLLFLILGSLGLFINVIEAATQPQWQANFEAAFSGAPNCAPPKSTLMAAVGVLIAGKFPATEDVAKLLYPNNSRFENSRRVIRETLDGVLCSNCRGRFRSNDASVSCLHEGETPPTATCSTALLALLPSLNSQGTLTARQTHDATATVARYIQVAEEEEKVSKIQATGNANRRKQYTWS